MQASKARNSCMVSEHSDQFPPLHLHALTPSFLLTPITFPCLYKATVGSRPWIVRDLTAWKCVAAWLWCTVKVGLCTPSTMDFPTWVCWVCGRKLCAMDMHAYACSKLSCVCILVCYGICVGSSLIGSCEWVVKCRASLWAWLCSLECYWSSLLQHQSILLVNTHTHTTWDSGWRLPRWVVIRVQKGVLEWPVALSWT